ncbi:LCP family protein [Candidatus Saccharibacteria bacterium]|nr:LCP family protein [Candidatus Saccharibacteria bacterium]
MSIDGIKSRGGRTGSIDGFSARPKHPAPRPVVKKSAPARKPLPQKIQTKKPEKAPSKKAVEKFLEPVEGFDFDISSDEITKNELKNVKKNIKKKQKKKKHLFRRILLVVLLLLVVLGTVVFIWGDSIISKITGGQSGILDVISFVQEHYVDLKTDKNGRTNILVFGTSGYDMEGTNGDYAHDGAQLTDTIMIVSLDQKSGDVAMINLPRDLKVSKYCTGTGKINEVYWCHNLDGSSEADGARALMDEVEDILGVELQYYAHVNWETLVSVVDTLDGIEVTLDEDIYAACDTGVYMNLYAGVPQKLNGKEALCVARTRYNTQNGDFSRNASQQKILIALKDRALEKGLGIIEAINIVNSLGDNVRTNVSLDEIKSGMNILKSFDVEKMRQVPLFDPGNDVYYVATTMENGISYVVPNSINGNYFELQKYIESMLSSDPIVREGSTIEVLNGTDGNGVASAEKIKLENEGFVVSLIGDAPEGSYDAVEIYVLDEKMSGTKEKLESFYNVKVKPSVDMPVEIVSSADFVIIIGKTETEE